MNVHRQIRRSHGENCIQCGSIDFYHSYVSYGISVLLSIRGKILNLNRLALHVPESFLQCDSMTLSSNPTVRRGSTPLPLKHQLRREEAVHDDCDWTSGAAGPSASPISFSPALDDNLTVAVEGRTEGPLRIALLGQNGVGKSSLAIALAGDMDRTASVDSDGAKFVCLTNTRLILCCTGEATCSGVPSSEQQVNKSQHPSPI